MSRAFAVHLLRTTCSSRSHILKTFRAKQWCSITPRQASGTRGEYRHGVACGMERARLNGPLALSTTSTGCSTFPWTMHHAITGRTTRFGKTFCRTNTTATSALILTDQPLLETTEFTARWKLPFLVMDSIQRSWTMGKFIAPKSAPRWTCKFHTVGAKAHTFPSSTRA